MNQNHYLNYAVYMTSHGDHLVKVTDGYFASDAWMKGDEAYADVTGDKFRGIFGDDGKQATCNKSNIRRLTSDKEFSELFSAAHPAFKFAIKCLEIFGKLEKPRIEMLEAKRRFDMWSHYLPELLMELPTLTPEEFVEYLYNRA